MEITPEQKQKLLDFMGYGNLDAPFWFLGMEEGSGGQDELTENIKKRIAFPYPVMDLQTAHSRSFLNWEYWDANQRVRFPSVWVYMAKIVRAIRQGADDWWDGGKAKQYVRDSLGRSDGETLLTELLPLPKRRTTDWPRLYRHTFNFHDRQAYEQEVLPVRKKMLREQISKHKPQYLFCYGRTNYRHYKELVDSPVDSWRPIQDTHFEIGQLGSTHIVLSPFWGNGQVGMHQMQKLVDIVRRLDDR